MGKKIQNYILQSIVGSGQFGKVYKAYNEKTNQIVAIKVIQIQKFRLSPKLQEFTINEINTLSKIEDSTHIVRFIQILKTANNYYFVYEFCNDGTLEQRIKSQGKFNEEKALNYFKQLLQAFKMLVKNNIMHRDIKPSNILLNNGIIKLADFGFCKPMKDSKDLAQTMLGSPIYMAPQILKGQIYTMKADIWSLGVVLYEMLYGFCPFQQRSIARLINLIDQGTVTFPSNVKISKNTQDLLKRMLVKDQFKRIEWRQLFQFNLNPIIDPIVTKPSTPYGQQPKLYHKSSSSKKQLPQPSLPSPPHQQQISNPFSKKHFQSVNTDQIPPSSGGYQERKYILEQKNNDYSNRNNSSNRKYYQNQRQISQQKDRRRSNTVHDIRDVTNLMTTGNNEKDKDNYINYQTNNNTGANVLLPGNLTMKKTRSSSISDVEKKIIQNILEKRQKIFKGVKMIEKFLGQSSSKLNVHICCFIAKRVTSLSLEAQDTIKKCLKQRQYRNKENTPYGSPSQIQKSIMHIQTQLTSIKEKLNPFEKQLSNIHEPQDIIFLRYGQEQHLTQQKQGLSQLLMIDDYLNISPILKNQQNNSTNSSSSQYSGNTLTPGNLYGSSYENNYSLRTKKELLEEYQKRILRNV